MSTCEQSASSAVLPETGSVNDKAPSAGGHGSEHLALDAPVLALIARLHAGTTLADRVRRMRGRRAGMAARRAVKATKADDQTTTTNDERTNDETERPQGEAGDVG